MPSDVQVTRINYKRGDLPEMFKEYPFEKIALDPQKGLVFGGDVQWNPGRPDWSEPITIIGVARPDESRPKVRKWTGY